MSKLLVKDRYATVPNEILNNENLTLRAKGLFAYIQSKPDDWNFSAKKIALQTKDGLDSVKAGLRELEIVGLLNRIRYQDKEGYWKVEYVLFSSISEKPVVDFPTQEIPMQENPVSGKPINIVKKILVKKNIVNKKEDTSSFFDIFWKAYPNKTNKKTTSDLWKSKRLDQKLEAILAFIEKAKETDRWKRKFIKAPDVFLRKESWTDDLAAYNDFVQENQEIIRI